MNKQGLHGIPRIIKAFGYSMQGFAAAWRNESAFREETLGALVLCPLAFWVGGSAFEIAFLIVMTLQVLVVELLNSAVEATVDRISAERHPLAGRAKDLASATVLLSIVLGIISWLAILWDRFL